MMKREPIIVPLAVAVVTYVVFGAYVEALILMGLFLPEMVIGKVLVEDRGK